MVNVNNGERFETYVIPGAEDSGTICLNGAAARLALPGDLIIIIAYGFFDSAESVDSRQLKSTPSSPRRRE